MCRSMVDIQSPTAEIRRGNKRRRKKEERNYRMKILWSALLHRATINSKYFVAASDIVSPSSSDWDAGFINVTRSEAAQAAATTTFVTSGTVMRSAQHGINYCFKISLWFTAYSVYIHRESKKVCHRLTQWRRVHWARSSQSPTFNPAGRARSGQVRLFSLFTTVSLVKISISTRWMLQLTVTIILP